MSFQFTKELTVAKPAKTVGGASSVIVGIDLGTTNSLVAIMKEGVPQVLKGTDGSSLIPSVISVVDGKVTVGGSAKRDRVLHSDQTAFSVKRLLGRSYEELKTSLKDLPYQVLPSEGDESGMVRIRLGDRTFTALELSAMILRELKNLASAALGMDVHRAVVTVPAYFNDAQRQATRTAGRLAGLEVVRIINEPTAASLAYGLDKKKQGLIAVYDLGGGTFDVSILRLHDGIFEVLSTAGDTQLGGDDLDRVIVDQAIGDIRALWNIDAYADRPLLALLLEEAERVKKALSAKSTEVFFVKWADKNYEREWTLEEFETRVRPLLHKTQAACTRALKDAGVTANELTDVVLVGGPTRLAVVQQTAREIFGREVNTSMHPDEVVAHGASIQADILAGNQSDLLLLDVVPLSLGIETYGGAMSVLIGRNSRIPMSAKEMYTNFVDGQNSVELHVLQGEREEAAQNRSLAKFKLRGLDPLPAATHRIEVSFVIDADGILQVAARDQRTGKETSVEVKPTYGLTDAEVEAMLEAGLNHAEDDFEFKRRVEARTEAEPVATATEKSLEHAKAFVANGALDTTDLEKIQKRLKDLKLALEHGDSQQIREAKGLLDKATVKLAELVVKELI